MTKTGIVKWAVPIALAGIVGATVLMNRAAPSQSREQLSGVWLIDKPVFAVRTADGGEPPLRPEAAELYQARQRDRANGDTSFDGATWCSALGMPRMMFINDPFEIIVRPQHVAFLHRWNWWARIAYLPGALDPDATAPPPPGIPGGGGPPGAPPGGPPGAPPSAGPPGAPPPGAPPGSPASSGEQEPEPGATGFAHAKWDGDVLVIETDYLVESTLLDSAGMPHSGALKLTERIRLRGPDVLENRIRIEDPATFTAPWETVVTFKRQAALSRSEDVCLDRIQSGEPAVKE